MSNWFRRKLFKIFLIGFLVGFFVVFLFRYSKDIETAFSILESVILSSVALFTAWWTYSTFGRAELREEVKQFIEGLTNYENAVNARYGAYGSLLQRLSETSIVGKEDNEKQIENLDIEVSIYASNLKRLFESSTHIPVVLRAKLILDGGFFFSGDEPDMKEFRKKILVLKEELRKSVKRGLL